MDGAANVISLVTTVITFITESISLSHEPSKLYDTTNSWRPLLGAGQNFLDILDIPFSPGKPVKLLLKATNIDNVDAAMKDLPLQEEQTIRVYFVENLGIYNERSPVAIPAFAGSSAMISQWSSSSKQVRWETHSYRLPLEPTLEGAGESLYIDSLSIATGTIRRTMRCMIDSMEDGRMTFHIDATSMIQRLDLLFDQGHLREHQAAKPSPEAAYAYHDDFCESLRSPIEAYPILGAQLTPASGLKQLLFLRYNHALVEDYCYLIYPLRAIYARQKEGLSDPRRATLTIPMLAEVTRDAYFYEEVNERATELAGAVDALVESLKILLMDTANIRNFQGLAVELQSTCTDLKRTLVTLSATLENHLRLFELSRGMHEAQSVRLLSILASIFLPLSLLLVGCLACRLDSRNFIICCTTFLAFLYYLGQLL